MARGYRPYRGSSGSGPKINFLLLLAIVVAAAVLFIVALQDYFVFTEDGIRFENPFIKGPDSSSAPSPSSTPQLIITTPEPSKAPTASPTPTPKTDVMLSAVYLPDIYDSVAVLGAIQLADKGIINAVVINMKEDDGTLSYNSQTEYAARVEAGSADDPTDLIEQLKDAGLYLVAEISAFKDNLVPRKIQSTSVKTQSGVIWLDRDYHGWLNPYNEDARNYVTDIALELSALGFDEILLRNFVYPTLGRPQLLHYGEDALTPKTDSLSAYAAELNKLLSRRGTALSIYLEESALFDSNPDTGQDPAALVDASHRLYTIINNKTDSKAMVLSYPSAKMVPVLVPGLPFNANAAAEAISSSLTPYLSHFQSYLIRDPSGFYPSKGWNFD